MAHFCIVCESKIFQNELISFAHNEAGRMIYPQIPYHNNCTDEFRKNEEIYIELGKQRNKVCVVCDGVVGLFEMRDGPLSMHTSCYEKYQKHPTLYNKNRLKALDWRRNNAIATAPHRPSLTSILAKKTGDTLKEKAIQSIVLAKNSAKTTKSIFKEADRRVGKVEDIKTEEDAYEFAAKEIEEETYKRGLWAKAFSDAEGNEKKQAALYIKYRAEQLIQYIDELV